MSNNLKYLQKPLSLEEIKSIANEDNCIEGIIAIEDSDMINNDFVAFLDILSEKLCNNSCLMDIQYEMIGCIPEENLILYLVSGDATEIIEED